MVGGGTGAETPKRSQPPALQRRAGEERLAPSLRTQGPRGCHQSLTRAGGAEPEGGWSDAPGGLAPEREGGRGCEPGHVGSFQEL